MPRPSPQLRALLPTPVPGSATGLTRRRFLSVAAAAGSTAVLAACGSDDSGGASADGSIEKSLNIYTWGEYDDPSTMKDFTKASGPKITLDSYTSNEEMIAKLVAAKGTSGYDIVVPSSYYIPQMIENDLLEPLTADLLPNLSSIAAAFRGSEQVAKYAVCKDWGTTGYVYDTTVITRQLSTWADFFDAAQHEASGKMSLLEDPGEVVAAYFNAHGIDENTTASADYAAAKEFLVSSIAPHVQAFDSYPGGTAIAQGQRALAHAWNGDARTGILANKTPGRYAWVLPTPTNRWQDNWAIAKGAPHPVAAHAFINNVLDPAVSLKELQYIGYDTGVDGVQDAATGAGVEMPELIFFSQDQVATMTEGKITSKTPEQTTIMDAMRAAASS